MKHRIWALAAAAAIVTLPACSEPVYSGSTAVPLPPANPAIGHAYVYHLPVRCGVDYAFFARHWWQADSPAPVPSEAHGYPYAYGIMTLVSPRRARFTWPGEPATVTFHPASAPPRRCR